MHVDTANYIIICGLIIDIRMFRSAVFYQTVYPTILYTYAIFNVCIPILVIIIKQNKKYVRCILLLLYAKRWCAKKKQTNKYEK